VSRFVPFQGNSMYPYLQSGDKLIFDFFEKPRLLTPNQDALGDIFMYRCLNGEIVCHRFISDQGGRLTLKGDWSCHSEVYDSVLVWGKLIGKWDGKKEKPLKKYLGLSFLFCMQKQMNMSTPRGLRWVGRLSVYILSWVNRLR
jgi:hypothetical protein